jgi:hypothetical protein
MSNAQHESVWKPRWGMFQNLDIRGVGLAQRLAKILSGSAAFDGCQGGKDFRLRLFECSRLGGFAGSDLDEMPAKSGADQSGCMKRQ